MKYIKKTFPPTSLEKYKTIERACYDDMPPETKDEVRNSLINEQGWLCCYCGKRIVPDHLSVIEHLLPKGIPQFSHLQLEYGNLLCSCDGGENDRKGKTKTEKREFPQHCDDKKNNAILKITPLDNNCEEHFSYDEEGNIYGDNSEADDAINVLGLDCSTLTHLRQAAIEPYVKYEASKSEWLEIIEDMKQLHNGQFRPFCFAVISYIQEFKLPLVV